MDELGELDKLIKTRSSARVVIIVFSSSWTDESFINPTIDRLARQLSDRVTFVKANVGENNDVMNAFGITSTPTFQFYRNGTKIDEFCGADEDQLRLYTRLHADSDVETDLATRVEHKSKSGSKALSHVPSRVPNEKGTFLPIYSIDSGVKC